MCVDVVWLVALALSLPAVSKCDPLFVLSAPNVLRLGIKEKVFVEAQGYTGNEIKVDITVKDFPAKKHSYLKEKGREGLPVTVSLNEANNFMSLRDILIPDTEFDKHKKSKQYVFLQAKFWLPSPIQLEKVVLVSFLPGYLFVQTDKPIYTPDDTVHYRIFPMNPDLEPIKHEVSVEIMNPDGITVKHLFRRPIGEDYISQNYKIPEIASMGTWKLVCGFGTSRENLFTAEFEVKEYVLPSFEVKLTPRKNFFLVNDTELKVDITAQYLYGQDVSGKAFVVFGVMTEDGEKSAIPASLKKVNIQSGTGTATLTREEILKSFPDINKLIMRPLYVSVTVQTDSGSEMVAAERGGIRIVTSPYTIRFKKTPTYFKPGMPFDVMVYVTNLDDTPAKRIDVEESGKWKVMGRTNEKGVAKLRINTQDGVNTLPITVTTKVPGLSQTQQAKTHMEAQAYKTHMGSKNYLHISLQGTEIKDGNLDMSLYLVNSPGVQEQINHLTYLVLSKGRLLLAERFKRTKGQSLIAVNVPVTKDMIPSFRVVAYYHVDKEVVSDSVWVDVKDTCMGTLKITTRETALKPRMPFTLTITGDPGANVGLVAVDKGVYALNNTNRLTQTKIWDIIEKQDTGCTTGGGADSMGVFYDAGLLFTSNAIETAARADPNCPVLPKSRQQRSVRLMEVKDSLVKKYTGQTRKCCMAGMVDNLLGYTCERRAEFIVDGEECKKAFLDCCKEVKKKTQEAKTEDLILARSEESDSSFDGFGGIVTRTKFDMSWLWEDIKLPPCPADNLKCESTSTKRQLFMLDSITTWEITAISVSKTLGICVADPYEVTAMKYFFIDLKLPYAAVRYEQLEIKAVLHNYFGVDIKVRVQLSETEHVCSAASNKKNKLIAEVEIEKMSSLVVPFVIIPMALGKHSIEVKAYILNFEGRDGIQKDLRVVAEGKKVTRNNFTVLLEPAKYAGGVQKETVVPMDLSSIVPGTEPQTFTSVTGELLSQTIDAAISGEKIGSLITQPTGCGEQNMMYITGPVIATHYLDTTQQWDKVGLDRRAEAINHILEGYTQQLAYRQPDGSFMVFKSGSHRPSTWLTAYVAKVFALANKLVPRIKEDVICRALKWLVLNTQQPDGIYKEVGDVYQAELMGGVNNEDSTVALTAFVLVAMREASDICKDSVLSLPGSMSIAKNFLAEKIHKLTNPYAVALTCYALANEGEHHLNILNRYASGGESSRGKYWSVPKNRYFTLEATGYALMALVKAKQFDQAGDVVRWLSGQRFYGGFYGSTQATIIVFQAIAMYQMELPAKSPTNLTVTLSVSGRKDSLRWTYSGNTMHVTRSLKFPYNKNLTFTAKGTGQGTLSVMTIYNALPDEKKEECNNFDLEVKIEKQEEATHSTAIETYLLTIEMMYKSFERDSTMSILDITMPTGFFADTTDLGLLTSGKDKYVQEIETDTKLSEKGSLIFYLNKVSHQLPDRVVFRIHMTNRVGLLQPAAVTLYEYNSLENRCTKFYHPEKKDGALNRICHEDVCRCAEENCSYQKKPNELSRYDTACISGKDYVYEGKVIEAELTKTIDRFTILVIETVIEGTDTGVKGKERTFLSHPQCRDNLGLVKGKTYLIMGPYSSLIIEGNRTMYMLSGETWIEYWPKDQECQEEKYKAICEDIMIETADLVTFGCST